MQLLYICECMCALRQLKTKIYTFTLKENDPEPGEDVEDVTVKHT